MVQVVLQSTLRCPECGYQAELMMPQDFCQFYYRCTGCGTLLRPRSGDCCVFCSHGSVPCPSVQMAVAVEECP